MKARVQVLLGAPLPQPLGLEGSTHRSGGCQGALLGLGGEGGVSPWAVTGCWLRQKPQSNRGTGVFQPGLLLPASAPPQGPTSGTGGQRTNLETRQAQQQMSPGSRPLTQAGAWGSKTALRGVLSLMCHQDTGAG